jgi:hypothetical protein
MESVFSEIGIPALDFIQISAVFLLTMLNFFALRDKKHRWVKYGSLLVFILQCIFIILFRDGLTVKFFAALMLISVLIVQAILTRRGELEAAGLHN